MGKSYEIEKYFEKSSNHTKDSLNELIDLGLVIYGDFINNKIFKESFTKLPKGGILIIEENDLYFYGSKSLLEKEFYFSIPYEDIKVISTPVFIINFNIIAFNSSIDKCKLSLSWEDYVVKNIKYNFSENLSNKIKQNLLRVVHNYLEKEDSSEKANFYYKRVLDEGIFSNRFINGIIKIYKKQAEDNSEGSEALYNHFVNDKKKALKLIYPNKAKLIDSQFENQYKDLRTESSIEFFNSFYSEYLSDSDLPQKDSKTKKQSLSKDEIINSDIFNTALEEEIEKREEEFKEKLNQKYKNQIEKFSEKLEIEKAIYREIIKDNIFREDKIKISEEMTNNFIDKLVSFYYSHKILQEKFPDTFTIERTRAKEGLDILEFILRDLSGSSIKIIDPYLFPSELDLLEHIPKQTNIKILTYAISTSNFKDKINSFSLKLEELRKKRLGKIEVKAIKFKNKNASPIHDRNIFSNCWGLRLSNSLSQIGRKHDVICSRIFNAQERVVDEFDDYWYLNERSTINRYKDKLIITEY